MNTAELMTTETIAMAPTSSWRDRVGIVASIGCAIHCALMPFVIAYLPTLGLSFLADEAFHKWMALICFLIAIAAFVPGIRKHGNWTPVAIGAVGLVLITFAAFGLAGECCASCQPVAPLAESSSSWAVDAECTSCQHCETCHSLADAEHEQSDAPLAATETENKQDLLSTLAPWITPFGGLLLVCAHLMNQRCGCLCSCCAPNSSPDAGDRPANVQLG